MMEESHWPLTIILFGVPSVAKYIQSYEQFDEIVDTVHFATIKIRRDKEKLTKLLFAFTVQVDIEIEQLVTQDFLA
jgi:hypothetical protein